MRVFQEHGKICIYRIAHAVMQAEARLPLWAAGASTRHSLFKAPAAREGSLASVRRAHESMTHLICVHLPSALRLVQRFATGLPQATIDLKRWRPEAAGQSSKPSRHLAGKRFPKVQQYIDTKKFGLVLLAATIPATPAGMRSAQNWRGRWSLGGSSQGLGQLLSLPKA